MKRHAAGAMIRWIIVIALLSGAAALAWPLALGWLCPQVSVTAAVEAPVVQAFYATGTLLPEREYPIKSNNPGIITGVLVDKGDKVSKDQPLAVVAEDSVQYRHDQAKADRDLKYKLADEKSSPALREFDARLAAAVEMLEIARREQKRVTDMLEKSAASAADLDRALDRVKTLWSEAEALKAQRATKKLELERDLEVAEAALKTAKWNLDRQTIRSPVDNAVVLDRPLSVGTRLAVNDHLMQIADVRPQSLVMRAAVDEEDKTSVRLGQVVRMALYAFPDRVFEGRVRKIYDKADPERRTYEIDVEMNDKSPAFSAGMTAELAFVVEQKDRAVVVPSQAVQGGALWVVRGGQLVKPDVKLGLRSVERTEVLSGLKADDRVVISPLADAREGQRVRTVFMDPVVAAGLNKPKAAEVFRGFR